MRSQQSALSRLFGISIFIAILVILWFLSDKEQQTQTRTSTSNGLRQSPLTWREYIPRLTGVCLLFALLPILFASPIGNIIVNFVGRLFFGKTYLTNIVISEGAGYGLIMLFFTFGYGVSARLAFDSEYIDSTRAIWAGVIGGIGVLFIAFTVSYRIGVAQEFIIVPDTSRIMALQVVNRYDVLPKDVFLTSLGVVTGIVTREYISRWSDS